MEHLRAAATAYEQAGRTSLAEFIREHASRVKMDVEMWGSV
jgi:hypothetical protein